MANIRFYIEYMNEVLSDEAIERQLSESYGVSMPHYEVSADCIDLAMLSYDDIKAMNDSERKALRTKCCAILESGSYGSCAYETAAHVYDCLWAIEDEEYYDNNIDAFIEYSSHYGEPDFDYDFYSDWHKDLYGVRPH